MSYQLTACGVQRLSDLAFIPQDPGNRDWLEYQQWLLAGGELPPSNEALESATPDSSVKTLAKKWLAGFSGQP